MKNGITHEEYKKCLFEGKIQMKTNNQITSHKHEIYTEEVNKIALSRNDDKRVITEDKVHTYAYGHYKLKQ